MTSQEIREELDRVRREGASDINRLSAYFELVLRDLADQKEIAEQEMSKVNSVPPSKPLFDEPSATTQRGPVDKISKHKRTDDFFRKTE